MLCFKSFIPTIHFKLLIIVLALDSALCSIDGNYVPRKQNVTSPTDDPCNPLYWYPRHIPAYCFYKKDGRVTHPPLIDERPMPIPIPVPLPPLAAPSPMIPLPPSSVPPFPLLPSPLPLPLPPPVPVLPPIMPHPMMPLPYPLPFGIPISVPGPIFPVAAIPIPRTIYRPIPIPPLPNVPNFIGYPPYIDIPNWTNNYGSVNILPFSDVFSDLMDKHRNNMRKKRFQGIMYDDGYNYKEPGMYEDPKQSRRRSDNSIVENVIKMDPEVIQKIKNFLRARGIYAK